MSSFDEKRPGERLTVAGIAAVIVVAVFVVCVILILSKSLFPSNSAEVPEDVYTGTKSAESSSVAQEDDSSSKAAVIVDDSGNTVSASGEDESIPNPYYTDSSAPDMSTSSVPSPSESMAAGAVKTLSQTAYLRSQGNENGTPLLSVSAGEQVTLLGGDVGEYVHVSYYGTEGYIWNGYLY